VLLAAVVALWLTVKKSTCATVHAGFWVDDAVYDSQRLGISLTREEIDRVAAVARGEIALAFRGLNIAFSDSRNPSYRVRVVEELRDLRFKWQMSVPAQSRAVSGMGGQGAVSLSWMASAAAGFVPQGAGRTALLDAIGTGVGRAAVHEFAHILLPRAPIHDSIDRGSYEYDTASRREQFAGDMHWDLAWRFLQKRLAPCAPPVP